MIGLVLKDILVMRKTIRTYAMFLLFYLVMTVLNLFTISFTTAILQLIVMLLPMSAFSFDEAAKWDRYALTFPLGRRALVSGRYLFALVMTVFAALCGLLSCVLVSIFDNQDMILENMMTVMVCLSLGLLYADILCSATSFLRNWDSILEKKRANLRSISEPARLRQPPPRSTGAAHARGRTQSIREERRIAAPPVLFALLWVRLLPALYGPFCGPLRPFGGCPWSVTPPARECLPPAPPDTRRRG